MGTIRRTICLPRDEDENDEVEGDEDEENVMMMMLVMPKLNIVRTNEDCKD